MYQLDATKSTKLAKKLGGPPVFHDGFLRRIILERERAVLEIEILSDVNPRLEKDTVVNLILREVGAFAFEARDFSKERFVIHDLDFRREDEGIRLFLESARGEKGEITFQSIELKEVERT